MESASVDNKAMLSVLSLVSAAIAGYAMTAGKKRSWMHAMWFAFIMAATAYVILDLEAPSLGLVRVAASKFMLDVLQSIR